MPVDFEGEQQRLFTPIFEAPRLALYPRGGVRNDYLSSMRPQDIVLSTPSGVCCKLGDFHIDPTHPVDKAVITHAHSDHARAGHRAVLATKETLDIMRLRFGEDFAESWQAIGYGESLDLGGARLTLHPAGHVLGSAQVLIEAGGLRIVASGDYKDVEDPTCAPFERLACDLFITEATFGLPVFRHGDPDAEIRKLLRSVALFPERTHLVGAYALGKAQGVMALIRKAGYAEPIYMHGGIDRITRYYQHRGVDLGRIELARGAGKLPGAIVLCPPSALKGLWSRRFAEPVTSIASGFMRVRARARQQLVQLPLVISDHADWHGLTGAILATGASEIWVTHGQEDAIVHWSATQGLRARSLDIAGYGEEDDAENASDDRGELQ
jgi:putative mRNA 3-end processing factor